MKLTKGFTPIELVIVIILLGILSALVLPRFLSTCEDAKVSSAKTFKASFETAVNLGQRQWQSDHHAQPFGNDISMSAQGWPIPVDETSTHKTLASDCLKLAKALIPEASVAVALNDIKETLTNSGGISTCDSDAQFCAYGSPGTSNSISCLYLYNGHDLNPLFSEKSAPKDHLNMPNNYLFISYIVYTAGSPIAPAEVIFGFK